MAKIRMFVYVMIIFLSLFLVTTNVEGKSIFTVFKFHSLLSTNHFIRFKLHYVILFLSLQRNILDVLVIQIVKKYMYIADLLVKRSVCSAPYANVFYHRAE